MVFQQAFGLAANELVALAFYLILLVPCAWIACQLFLSVKRDVEDLRGLCGPQRSRRSRPVVIDPHCQ